MLKISKTRYGRLGLTRPNSGSLHIEPLMLWTTADRPLLCHCRTTSDPGSWTGRVRTRIASMKL